MDQSQTPVQPIAKMSLPSIDKLFGDTWAQFQTHFWKYFMVALIPAILTYIVTIVMFLVLFGTYSMAGGEVGASLPAPELHGVTPVAYIILVIAMIVLGLWQYGSLVYTISSNFTEISLGESLRRGSSYILPLLWISIIQGLLGIMGFFVFVLPAFVFGVWFMFSVFIMATEETRGYSALLKSREYVRGYWWGVFGRILLMGLIIGVINFVVVLLLGLLVRALGLPTVALSILQNVFSIVITVFSVTFVFNLFNQLKSIQDPVRVQTEQNKSRKEITIIAVIGLILMFLFGILLWSAYDKIEQNIEQRTTLIDLPYHSC